MKTRSFIFITIVFIIFLSSCINKNEQNNNAINNTANDTTGFYQAKDLQGLSVFIIGNSTYNQVLKHLKSEFKDDKRYYFYSDIDETKYDTLVSYLEEDLLRRNIFGCPDLRTIEISKYYIGDIEVSYLKLDFFRDTLFNIRCWQNDEIEEGFKSKYGEGRLVNNSVWKTPKGETNIRPENDEILKKSQLLKIDKKQFGKISK